MSDSRSGLRRVRWAVPALVATSALGMALLPATAAAASAQAAVPAAEGDPGYAVGVGDSYMSGEGGVWSNRGWASAGIGTTNDVRYWRTGEAVPKVSGGDLNQDGFYSGFAYGDAESFQSVDGTESEPLCHRSAWMPTVGLSDGGVNLTAANLACSGALTDTATGSDGVTRPGVDFADVNGVKGQATRLQEFAETHEVPVVALSVGGNDLGFAAIGTACVEAYSYGSDACNSDADIQAVLATAPQVKEQIKTSISNVVDAMRAAGKPDGSWKLIYQTPVLPLAELDQIPDNMPEQPGFLNIGKPRSVAGCPIYNADWTWITDTVFPLFVNTMTGAIQESEAKLEGIPTVFIDHTGTFDGHRLCQAGAVDTAVNYEGGTGAGPGDADTKALWGPTNGQGTEWATGIVIADQLTGSAHQKQNPLHPNYWGQRALSACLDGIIAEDVENKIYTCAQDPGEGQDEKLRPKMTVSQVGDIWTPAPPATPSVFLPLPAPVRVVDGEAFTDAETKTYNVKQLAGEDIPENATGLAVNITAANTANAGHAELFPGDLPDEQAYPTSVLNWTSGERLANGVSVKMAADGTVKVRVEGGPATIFLDVVGYYRDVVPTAVQAANGEPTGTFVPLAQPERVFDATVPSGTGTLASAVDVDLSNGGSLFDPTEVLGVVYNLTADTAKSTGPGHLRVQPSDAESLTQTSALNWSAADVENNLPDVVANSSVVKPGPDGKVKLYNGAQPVRGIIDVQGYFINDGTGAVFYPINPTRVLDTRDEGGPLADDQVLDVNVAAAVPAEAAATAVAFNLTEAAGSGRGHMVTWPSGVTNATSMLNWPTAARTRANATMLGLAGGDEFKLRNRGGTAQAVVDVMGYFGSQSQPAAG